MEARMRLGFIRKRHYWLASILLAGPAQADLGPLLDDGRVAAELADTELQGIRGRYVSGNRIDYFGIEMVTQWTTPDGKSVNGGFNIGFDFGVAGSLPRVLISSIAFLVGADDTAESRNRANGGGGDLSRVQGVGQLLQISGDHNGVANEIHLTIGERPSTDRSHWVQDTATAWAGDGAFAGTFVESGAMGVTVDIPGQGVARQAISANGLHQMIRITGDTNQVTNHMNMGVEFRPGDRFNPVALQSALETLRGLENTF